MAEEKQEKRAVKRVFIDADTGKQIKEQTVITDAKDVATRVEVKNVIAGEAGGLSLAGLPPLSVAIQAGGESRRMGRSKATVPFLGRPLLERIVTRVAPIAAEIVITTNEPENLGFLDDHPARGRIPQSPAMPEPRKMCIMTVSA